VLRVFRGQLSPVTGAAFSPDGALLAAACDDSETVGLWDPRTGRALATFDIDGDATCVDFAPDGATARSWLPRP
jgi:WD40 repeat protein